MRRLSLLLALLLCWVVIYEAPALAFPTGWFLKKKRRQLAAAATTVAPVTLSSPAGVRYCVFGLGQSAFRDDGTALSTTQNDSHLRASGVTLIDLVEPAPGDTGEAIDTAILHQLTDYEPAEDDWIYWKRYQSGALLSEISQDTAIYNLLATQGGQADTQVAALPAELQCVAFVLLIGNSDSIAVSPLSAAGFADEVRQIRRDLQSDFAAFVHPDGLTMFVSMPAAWTTTYESTVINDGFVLAADAEPGRIILMQPEYAYVYTDTYHKTDVGHRNEGQTIGKVIEAQFFDLAPRGLSWRPMRPASIVADGDVARLYVDVPCLRYATPRCGANPLAHDTTLVSARTDDGFRYIDDGIGFPPTISSIASASTCAECGYGQWRIDITMSGDVRSGSSFDYAYYPTGDGSVNFACEPAASYAPGCNAAGNWRDTDTTVPESGSSTLYNWLIHFPPMAVSGGVEPTGAPTIANAQAIEYSDDTEYVEVLDDDTLDFTTAFTYFEVIRPTGTIVAARNLISKWTPTTGQSWLLRTDGVDADDLVFYATSTSNFARCTGCDIPTDATTCVALVYDGSQPDDEEADFYTGAAGGPMTRPAQSISGDIPSTLLVSTAPVRFGYTSVNLDGVFDSFALWNVVLTNDQLSAICGAYSQTTEADLMNLTGVAAPVLWINAEGDSGTAATDKSGNGNDGTLTSGAAFVSTPAP